MVDRLLVVIQADDIGELRATGRRHAAEMPEPEDNDFHARFSSCAFLKDPGIRAQPVHRFQDGRLNSELVSPTGVPNFYGSEIDKRIIAHPPSIAAGKFQLRV